MKIITDIAVFFNIFILIVLLFGLFFKFENPKQKAAYGITMAISMISYLLTLSTVIAFGAILKHNFNMLYLVLCVISPFVIGYFVKYETLKKYTVIQILFFAASLIFLFWFW
ncbi:hypothetical protein IJ843_03575 [bacterium]|nr:hypothetical protein [bacterium]